MSTVYIQKKDKKLLMIQDSFNNNDHANSEIGYLETIANENDKETRKERYIYPEKRQEIIDDPRLI